MSTVAMNIVLITAGVIFAVAALLAVYRVVRGPGILDRMIASDMLMTTLICVLGVEMVVNRHITLMPVMIGLALTGFLSSVAVARYVSNRRPQR
ncbi:MAG: monovalent cation/H+ antiporter complex subunit F [Microbacteriaceae bacterium]